MGLRSQFLAHTCIMFKTNSRLYSMAFRMQWREMDLTFNNMLLCMHFTPVVLGIYVISSSFTSYFIWQLVKRYWGCLLLVSVSVVKESLILVDIHFFLPCLIVLNCTVTCSSLQSLADDVCVDVGLLPVTVVFDFYVVFGLTGNSCYGSGCSCRAQSGHPARWHMRRKSGCRHQSTPTAKGSNVSKTINLYFLDTDFQTCHIFLSLHYNRQICTDT